MDNNEPKLVKEIQDPKNTLSNGKTLPSTCDFTAVIFSPHMCSQAGVI